MKKKLLDYLKCLNCGGVMLTLEAYENTVEAGDAGACLEGVVRCPGCGAWYPVIDGIPRFLTGRFLQRLYESKKDFFMKHGLKPESVSDTGDQARTILKRRTQDSFGFQWQLFGEMDEASYRKHFLSFIDPPVKPEFFRGKLGADIGCGFGRHLYFAAKWGASMVGVDLSDALYPAYRNTKDIPAAHLVQADIYRLPLRNIFDFAYSLGVLHHLPDPFGGFSSMVPLVRPGGSVFVWVYSKNAPEMNFIVESLRAVFRDLPHRVLYWLCFVITAMEWYFVLLPYRILAKFRPLKRIADLFLPHHVVMYAGYPFRMNFADWQDRLSAPKRWYFDAGDMKKWFEKHGFKNIMISRTERYGYRAFGEK